MIFQLVSPVYAATTWGSDCVSPEGVATIKGVECLFQNIISPIPALLALVAVGMIVIAGIRLLTAGGDPKAVAAAWSTFTWAVIGLILLAAAWLVIVLIERFTGANISTFKIGL
jgi:hypothetical protein